MRGRKRHRRAMSNDAEWSHYQLDKLPSLRFSKENHRFALGRTSCNSALDMPNISGRTLPEFTRLEATIEPSRYRQLEDAH